MSVTQPGQPQATREGSGLLTGLIGSMLRALVRYGQFATDGPHLVGSAGEPAFGTGWSYFGNNVFTAPTQTVAFWRDPFGKVHLRGNSKKSAAVGGGAVGVMFTLPAGYRPSKEESFLAQQGIAGGTINVYVDTGGNVYIYGGYPTANVQIGLSGISFDTR